MSKIEFSPQRQYALSRHYNNLYFLLFFPLSDIPHGLLLYLLAIEKVMPELLVL